MFISIMWTPIVGYFTDLSEIACVYGIITLLIIKQSHANQKAVCMKDPLNTKADINSICKTRLSFNFTESGQAFRTIYMSTFMVVV